MRGFSPLLVPLTLLASAGMAEARINEKDLAAALRGLNDRDLERRSEARALIRLAGTNGAERMRPALETTQTALLKSVPQLAAQTKPAGKAFHDVTAAYDGWRQSVTSTLTMVRTELKGDSSKLHELSQRLDSTDRRRSRLLHLLRRGEFADAVGTLKHLRDIQEDLAWLAGCPGRIDAAAPVMPKGIEFDPAVKALLDLCLEVMSAEGLRVSVGAVQKRYRWPEPGQRAFAEILNDQRAAVGLQPLLLSEHLTEAAIGHSEEMFTRNYFAHESPVEKNKTHADRARNASFDGRVAGENIYRGSNAPGDAFAGWLASDGHRFIMFGNGVTALGIGCFAAHWTMMTGSFRVFPF